LFIHVLKKLWMNFIGIFLRKLIYWKLAVSNFDFPSGSRSAVNWFWSHAHETLVFFISVMKKQTLLTFHPCDKQQALLWLFKTTDSSVWQVNCVVVRGVKCMQKYTMQTTRWQSVLQTRIRRITVHVFGETLHGKELWPKRNFCYILVCFTVDVWNSNVLNSAVVLFIVMYCSVKFLITVVKPFVGSLSKPGIISVNPFLMLKKLICCVTVVVYIQCDYIIITVSFSTLFGCICRCFCYKRGSWTKIHLQGCCHWSWVRTLVN